MRIVMMGAGTFAEPTFEALLSSAHPVAGLVTQPDRAVGQERGSTRQTGRGMKTINSINRGLNLTPAGKGLMILFGLIGLLITGLLLSNINWRSRDFNLKTQRRNIRLVNLPKGKPAVPVS